LSRTGGPGTPRREARRDNAHAARMSDNAPIGRVAVIGAGFAGCAAAVALARSGVHVVLHEAAPMPGGRARTVMRDGLPLDNGQHLLLGAYSATRALMATLHPHGAPLARGPLAIDSLASGGAPALRAWNLPAPLGLAAGLLGASGYTLADRLAAMRACLGWKRARFQCDTRATVADLLAPLPRAVAAGLWEPLCVAALNTPPARASAQVFLNVVAAAFDADARAAEVVMPTGSLGATVPEAALRWLADRGHAVRLRSRATIVAIGETGVELRTPEGVERMDGALVATGPHQLARAFDPEAGANPAVAAALARAADYAYESITTVYLGFRGARMALPHGLIRLDDSPGQWLFARDDILRDAAPRAPALDQLLAVVISTGGAHDTMAQPALVDACVAQLRRARPALADAAWSQVIAERRATYACTPALAHPAPRLSSRLWLAGDYAYPAFPATLEAAVRSGEAAAAALASACGRGASAPDASHVAPPGGTAVNRSA
jgi:squalene-associated FAD-dependent desaturase